MEKEKRLNKGFKDFKKKDVNIAHKDVCNVGKETRDASFFSLAM